ncbi:MAG: hypothetical protein QOF98_1944 [Streptomyces sp.]|nr:hypothetical protein [Streptomyces sp.]
MRCRSRTFSALRTFGTFGMPTGAGIAAAAVAAVLALGGCSSSGDDTTQPTADVSATASGTAGSSASSTASGTDTATSTASGDSTQDVGGVWLATEDGDKVQLVLGKGTAGLTSTSLCGGSYTEKDDVDLTLTCVDGNKDRTTGHGVMSADGKTLTVQWTDGPTDVFSRTGLPSS